MRFKIDWASLIVGRKFAVFALIYIVFEGNFQLQVPGGGGLYLEGQFNGGFFALRVWGADIWRGLFSEFYGISYPSITKKKYAYIRTQVRNLERNSFDFKCSRQALHHCYV